MEQGPMQLPCLKIDLILVIHLTLILLKSNINFIPITRFVAVLVLAF